MKYSEATVIAVIKDYLNKVPIAEICKKYNLTGGAQPSGKRMIYHWLGQAGVAPHTQRGTQKDWIKIRKAVKK